MCKYYWLHDKVHMWIFEVWYVYYLHLSNRDHLHFHCPAPLHIHYCLRCLCGVHNRHWLVTVAVVTVTVVWRDLLYMGHTQLGSLLGTKMQKSYPRASTPSYPAMKSFVQAHLGAVRPVFSSGYYHLVPLFLFGLSLFECAHICLSRLHLVLHKWPVWTWVCYLDLHHHCFF